MSTQNKEVFQRSFDERVSDVRLTLRLADTSVRPDLSVAYRKFVENGFFATKPGEGEVPFCEGNRLTVGAVAGEPVQTSAAVINQAIQILAPRKMDRVFHPHHRLNGDGNLINVSGTCYEVTVDLPERGLALVIQTDADSQHRLWSETDSEKIISALDDKRLSVTQVEMVQMDDLNR